MENNFGNPEKFAIQYTLLPNPHNERGILKESWGAFKLIVEGNDICQYTINNETIDYNWNLIYIIEWLCENLHYLLGYDPFPLPVKGENTLELIKNADEYEFDESDEDDDMYLWYQAKSLWIYKHSWFCNRDGSFLTNVYFRRIGDSIDISWDNVFYREKGIIFVHPRGTSIIAKTEFKGVVIDFLNDILSKLGMRVSDDIVEDKNKIAELWRKVKLLEP